LEKLQTDLKNTGLTTLLDISKKLLTGYIKNKLELKYLKHLDYGKF